MKTIAKRKTKVAKATKTIKRPTTVAAPTYKPGTTVSIRNNKDYDRVMVRIDELIEIPDNKQCSGMKNRFILLNHLQP
jgi:hypothetical protein